ncbi:hypothetical protein [uncultured Sphingomonas sp.]
MKLIPASSAAWIVAMLSSSFRGCYRDILLQPRPSADTSGPLPPIISG